MRFVDKEPTWWFLITLLYDLQQTGKNQNDGFFQTQLIIVTIIESYVHSSLIKRTSFFHITPLVFFALFLLAGSMSVP